jgi:hypothetical protein
MTMAIALYDLTVSSYLQVLGGMKGVLQKGADHCKANNIDPQTIVDGRMIDDMLPFSFQVAAVAHHSIGAIEGLKKGVFSPPSNIPPDYAGLQKLLADAETGLKAVTAAEINALEGKDMLFQMRDIKIPFTAEGFIMSFSLPNFYFHAATAYDILRQKGVKLGKRDFLGQMRMKM